jgi:hypothetical protein
MMVFLELKEHKGFRVRKERFRDIRELKVPKEPQVLSVLQGQHKGRRDLRVHKALKELKVHKVRFKGLPEDKVPKEEQEILELPVTRFQL